MKIINVIKFVFLLGILLLTGCACMDLSMNDTAIPLKAKQMQYSNYLTLGWDPFTVAGVTPDTVGYHTIDGYDTPRSTILFSLQGSVGLGRELEIGAKYCNHVGSFSHNHTTFFSYKTYLKYRFYHPNERISLSVEPTYGHQENLGSVPFFIGNIDSPPPSVIEYEFAASSFEFPVLLTISNNHLSNVHHTFVLRPSYDIFSIAYADYLSESDSYGYNRHFNDLGVWRVGFYYEFDFVRKMKPIRVFLSLGCEIGALDKGKKSFMPVISYGSKIATKEPK